MLKIAVVEDQTEVRESLCQFIRQYAGEQGLQAEVEPFADGAVIAEGYQPGYDIIFLDVEMPRLGGFGAAERIRAVDPDVVLVFVTNMAQYAIKGYEVDALDYVLKPVSYGAFCTKLSRAIQRVQRRKGGQVALQLSGGGMQLLDTGDILYLETRNRMLYYHTATQEYAVPRETLEEAENAARLYDAGANSGNEVLDVVLTEKTLLCQSRRVQLNAVANGSCLQGFEPGDLYALFANALDYAIEGAVRTPDPARRNIDLLVCVRQSFIVINVISPAREPEAAATRTEAYELKVLRRIVQKYSGTLTTETQNGFFAIKIIFPLKQGE